MKKWISEEFFKVFGFFSFFCIATSFAIHFVTGNPMKMPFADLPLAWLVFVLAALAGAFSRYRRLHK
jgi:hypothetical protein